MIRSLMSALAMLALAGSAQAALFSGGAAFVGSPTSQVGAVTNNLIITNTANGFVVSGQILINVAPGSAAGTLIEWTIERPLDPTYGFGTETTTTILTGFSAPPIGIAGNTAGAVSSYFTSIPIPSLSQVPMNLVAGVDSPAWASLTDTTAPFPYVSGGTEYLRQTFQLDGTYSGPGGIWVIDVPVTSEVITVPEVSSVLMSVIGLAAGGLFLRRRRS